MNNVTSKKPNIPLVLGRMSEKKNLNVITLNSQCKKENSERNLQGIFDEENFFLFLFTEFFL